MAKNLLKPENKTTKKNAWFDDSTEKASEGVSTIKKNEFNLHMIDINLLVPSEKNIYEIGDISPLIESIEEQGLLDNLVVRPIVDGKYEILSGHRRYSALKEMGREKVPCQVKEDLNDVDAEILLLQANAKTRILKETEKAKQIKRLEELYNLKKENGDKVKGKVRDLIGAEVGLSGAQVQRYSQMNKLIPELQQMIDDKKIIMSAAINFSDFDEEAQYGIYELLNQNIQISRDDAKKLKEEFLNKKNEFEVKSKEFIEDKLRVIQENESLKLEISELQSDIDSKEEQLNSIDTNMDKVKKDIIHELNNKNEIEVKKLKDKLKDLESEKNNIEKEKQLLKTKLESPQADNIAEIELNAEIKATIKEIKAATLEVIQQLVKAKEGNLLKEDTINLMNMLKKDAIDKLYEVLSQC